MGQNQLTDKCGLELRCDSGSPRSFSHLQMEHLMFQIKHQTELLLSIYEWPLALHHRNSKDVSAK